MPNFDSKKDRLLFTYSIGDIFLRIELSIDQTIVYLFLFESLFGIGIKAKIPFSEKA